MRHIVRNETEICPKCLKSHAGAMVYVMDFYACTSCFYDKYLIEMHPKIEKMVTDYFKPEFEVVNDK